MQSGYEICEGDGLGGSFSIGNNDFSISDNGFTIGNKGQSHDYTNLLLRGLTTSQPRLCFLSLFSMLLPQQAPPTP